MENKVYTLEKLSQDSKLKYITTIDGITYFYGIADSKIDKDAVESNISYDSLQEKIVEAQNAKKAELNLICDKLISQFKSSATGEERIYDANIEDQLNIMAIVAANVDSFFRCSKDGITKENIKHTAEQMKQVFADGLKYKSVIIGICGILKAYVESQYDCDKIKTIQWSWFDTENYTIRESIPENADLTPKE